MKRYLLACLASAVLACTAQAQTATPPNSNPPTINFDKTKDLFIPQFDSKPDPDDLQAIAAVGSMLAHPDLHNVDYFAVQGSVGRQTGGPNQENNSFIRDDSLMTDAFGAQNVRWTQAGQGRRDTFPDGWNGTSNPNWTASVTRVRNKAKTALDRGGKVYVMEAGNADFTHDWVQELIAQTSYTTADTKTRIVVVQHSNWNEENTTTAAVLNWVRNNTDYRRIEDGNGAGNSTPGFKNNTPNWINNVRTSTNPNAYTRNLWEKAWQAYQGLIPSWSSMGNGLADFSDTVEAWYIFNIGTDADSISKFVARYVHNAASTGPVPGPDGGTPGSDTVDCSLLPTSIVSAASFDVQVPYTATGPRDVTVEWYGNSVWGGVFRTTVGAGSGTATVTVTPNGGAPAPGSTGEFRTSLRAVGAGWQNPFDGCPIVNVTVTGAVGSNELICSSLPTSVTNESTINVALDYEATASRDIYLEVRRVADNGWVTSKIVTVPAGSSTALISLNIGTQADGLYKFTAGMYNVGENWSNGTAYDNCSQVQFTLTSDGSGGGPTTNELICSSLPTSVPNETTINVALDYEATDSRDIYLEVRRVADNGWVTSKIVNVAAGSSTALISLNIGTQADGLYKFTAGMYNVGENWSNGTAYDNCSQVQFTLGSSGGTGGTVTETPIEDAYIQGTTPFNDSNLKVEPGYRVAYLKFDVNGVGGTVTGAKLVFQNTEAGSGTVRVYEGNSNTAWTEATLTASNAPGQGAQLGSLSGSYANGGSAEIDLGTSISNGVITFVLTMDGGGNDVWFSSSEGGTSPRLEITYQ
ncbi:DUF7594 domain-containing protein [Coraliomargarita akajimensis]|uniref:Carbohydrate-binding module family 96 domain-containing protein n=1 Tax=Coraliomargarita akajimensis (strain DSM 45221 / IAM 15411 / JCM 23193 / KCTC 12865 / 04OKA010-24) TaxID=583355 RepID=D5EL14_CORAD|nr:hypothetical protein [Coraliomargarita akajimensis]ADE53116.1 hypothetical protein Caka_0087 [Coraliomargarita akajimensis DSM 45221]